jgi:hypothetical protein
MPGWFDWVIIGLILVAGTLIMAAILQWASKWLAGKLGTSILAPMPWVLSMLGMWLVFYFNEVINADTLFSDPLGALAVSAVNKLEESVIIVVAALGGYFYTWREQRSGNVAESKTDD